MSRTVFCDEKYLESFKEKANSSGFVPGLIIGQASRDKDYITLLAPTPNFNELDSDSPSSSCVYNKLSEFEDKWISAHAASIKHVLTGGMSILGVFLVDTSDGGSTRESEAISKLRSLTSHLTLSTRTLPYYKSYIAANTLILYYSVAANKIVCKVLVGGALSGSLEATKVKMTGPESGWLSAECTLNMSLMDPFLIPPISRDMKSLVTLLKDVYQRVEGVVRIAGVAVEGRFISPGQLNGEVGSTPVGQWVEEVRELSAKLTKAHPGDGPAQVSLYALYTGSTDMMSGDDASKMTFCERESEKDSMNVVRPHGALAARIHISSSTPLRDVVQCIKEDLLRSLSAKLELYASAFENDLPPPNKDGVWSHDLPRRIVFGVDGLAAEIAEYVVGDESPKDAAESLSTLLGIHVLVDDIRRADAKDSPKPTTPVATNTKDVSSKKKVSAVQNKTLVAVIGVSVFVLIVSMVVHFMVK